MSTVVRWAMRSARLWVPGAVGTSRSPIVADLRDATKVVREVG